MSGIMHRTLIGAQPSNAGGGILDSSFAPTVSSQFSPASISYNGNTNLTITVSGLPANKTMTVPLKLTPSSGIIGNSGFSNPTVNTNSSGAATLTFPYSTLNVTGNKTIRVDCFNTVNPVINIGSPPATLDNIPTYISSYRSFNGDIGANNPPAEGYIVFRPDGTVMVYEDNFGGAGNYSYYNYYIPTTANIGGNFYIKAEYISGGNNVPPNLSSNDPLNVITRLNGNFTMGYKYTSNSGANFGAVKFSLYSDQAGTNLLSTTTINFEVGYEQ